MTTRNLLATVSSFAHRQMLWLLVASYLLAGLAPGPGLTLRTITVTRATVFDGSAHITISMVVLAVLLFNAGLGLEPAISWKHLGRLLLIGLVASLAVPLGFILCLRVTASGWHNPDELENLLSGLALVAAMPIAGSSTAWSQNADGDMNLSLGLVLTSTLLAPLTTLVVLHCVGFVTTGYYAEDLQTLANGRIGTFLILFVLCPSLLAMAYRAWFGEIKGAARKNGLRLINVCSLLILTYSNASASLPIAFYTPDLDFRALIFVVVIALCILCFGAGWIIASMFEAKRSECVAMTFGLRIANNGTGLVVASAALANHPMAMLPLILYNLTQHMVAAGVGRLVLSATSQHQFGQAR